MTLLVVAYPHMPEQDYTFIQSIRRRHDPQVALIEPHVTLVFPTDGVDPAVFIEHVAAQSAGIGRITLALRCATIVKDAFSSLTHLFLVPDEGNSAIVRAHDRLYTGPLTPHLRLDVPFIPHVTVGAFADAHAAKVAADAINAQPLALRGVIERLDVIHYAREDARVWTLARIPLTPA